MRSNWDDRIARAAELGTRYPGASRLLSFYRTLALFQKSLYSELLSNNETNIHALTLYFPDLISLVWREGTDLLANFGRHKLGDARMREDLLAAIWEGEGSNDLANDPAGRFFARVLLQPYAEYLASRGQVQSDAIGATCPFCNARPVAGVLRGEGEGAKRWLLCSLCSTEWAFRRVLCPGCGEENKDRLPVYTAEEFDAVRVDACDSCHTYLKSIDFTKDGHGVAIVDEIASVALNIWAEEHGYTKLETNLLGM